MAKAGGEQLHLTDARLREVVQALPTLGSRSLRPRAGMMPMALQAGRPLSPGLSVAAAPTGPGRVDGSA